MFTLQKSNKKVSSRPQIDIQGARDSVLILSRNRYRMVLQVSSVNFELKSEDEQDIIIDTYESFLNSIGFPLQILIRTREIDLDKYLDGLKERLGHETESIYKDQLSNYDSFIRSLITTNRILTRHFYIILPYNANSKLEFDSIHEQLKLLADIATKGLARIGMQARQLDSLETLDLFYSFYSPEQAKVQPLTNQTLELLHNLFIQKEIR